MKFLLQQCHGRLVEVDDGGDARKEHGHEEDDADYAAAGHAVEYVHQIDEHKARAAGIGAHAACRHGREDDQGSEHGGDGVKDRDVHGAARYALLFAEVGAVDHRAVPGYGKREKRLAEREDIHFRVDEPRRVEGEDVLITRGRTGQCEDVYAQADEQGKQYRHEELVRLFYAARDAQRHHNEGHDDGHYYPRQVVDRDDVESTADGSHVLTHGVDPAGEGHLCVLEYPTKDHRIAYGKAHGAYDGDDSNPLAYAAFTGALLRAHAESPYRARAGFSAEGELLHDAGGGYQHYEDKIREKKSQSTVSGHHDGETPYVAHSDCGPDAGKDKSHLALKSVTVLYCGTFTAHNQTPFCCVLHLLSYIFSVTPFVLYLFCFPFTHLDRARGRRGNDAWAGSRPTRCACSGWIHGPRTAPSRPR